MDDNANCKHEMLVITNGRSIKCGEQMAQMLNIENTFGDPSGFQAYQTNVS